MLADDALVLLFIDNIYYDQAERLSGRNRHVIMIVRQEVNEKIDCWKLLAIGCVFVQ